VLHDQNTDEVYIPLSHVSPKQAQINIVDSLLSEEAVLAFEYGYATAEPNYLVIWKRNLVILPTVRKWSSINSLALANKSGEDCVD